MRKYQFGIGETIGIENYFHQEINQRKLCSKILSKYATATVSWLHRQD